MTPVVLSGRMRLSSQLRASRSTRLRDGHFLWPPIMLPAQAEHESAKSPFALGVRLGNRARKACLLDYQLADRNWLSARN